MKRNLFIFTIFIYLFIYNKIRSVIRFKLNHLTKSMRAVIVKNIEVFEDAATQTGIL